MNTPFSVRTVLFSRAFAKTNLASCSVRSVRSSVRGLFPGVAEFTKSF